MLEIDTFLKYISKLFSSILIIRKIQSWSVQGLKLDATNKLSLLITLTSPFNVILNYSKLIFNPLILSLFRFLTSSNNEAGFQLDDNLNQTK